MHQLSLPADEATSSNMVFETAELLEIILLMLPQDDLIRIQRVCKRWNQTLAGSGKLQTSLGLYSFGGRVKDMLLNHTEFSFISDNGKFQLREVSHNHPIKSYLPRVCGYMMARRKPSQAYGLDFTAAHYRYLLTQQASKVLVTLKPYISDILPMTRRLCYTLERSRTQFCYTSTSSYFAIDKDVHSWRNMYATQPATNCLMLEPWNDYAGWCEWYMLRDDIQSKLFDHVIILNESGVKIGDVVEAAEHVKQKIIGITEKVDAKWQTGWRDVVNAEYWGFFLEREQLLNELDARSAKDIDDTISSLGHIPTRVEGESTDIDPNEGDDEGSVDDVCSECGGEKEYSPDEWRTFYFCLTVPGDYQKLLKGIKE